MKPAEKSIELVCMAAAALSVWGLPGALTGLLGDPAYAQAKQIEAGQEIIRVRTVLVMVPVIVLDRDGRYVSSLTKNDFRVSEDGVEQEIADFKSIETPFHVVLMLDTSPSAKFKLREIQDAAIAFLNELRAEDRVMIASFDHQVYADCEFTSDREQLRRAISRTRTGKATRLYDAVDLIVTERLKQIEGRKAIVLFTDGIDTFSSGITGRDSIELVEESSAMVYAVRYQTDAVQKVGPFKIRQHGPGDSRIGERYLQALAEGSGGRLYQADTVGDLAQAFSAIAGELRHQYWLSYYPTKVAQDGTWRRIKVTVSQPGLVVRARQGYRASAPAKVAPGDQDQIGKRPKFKIR